MEQDFREWNRIQSYLESRNQMAVNTERVLNYRKLAAQVCAHYNGCDDVNCPGFVALARKILEF